MDLEIADYERTVQSLHDTVADRETKIRDANAEITRLNEKIASLNKQLGESPTDTGNGLKGSIEKDVVSHVGIEANKI